MPFDSAAFWDAYGADLLARFKAAWGTGADFDLQGFPADPAAHVGAAGPRLEPDGLPARVAYMLERAKAKGPAYLPPFDRSPSLRKAAKAQGITTMGALRAALQGA